MKALEERVRWLEQVVLQQTGVNCSALSTGAQISVETSTSNHWYQVPSFVASSCSSISPPSSVDEEPLGDAELLAAGKVFSERLENTQHIQDTSAPCTPVLLTSREEAEILAREYFESLGYQYPFLYWPSFAQDMSCIYEQKPISHAVHFFYHITMAIAISIRSCDGVNSERFYQASRTSLQGVLRRENLTAVQALLSLALYSLFSTSGPSVWHTLGTCMRLATAVGLQKGKTELPINTPQHEMEKRTFWSIYALDRLVSVSLGRPLGIADEDITISLPGEYDDTWVEAGRVCSMSIPVHVIKLRRVFSRIYQIFYRTPVSAHPDVNKVIGDFRLELDSWRVEAPLLPWAIHYSTSYFDYLYYTTLILLYKPNQLNPAPNDACIIGCGDASIQVIRTYYDAYSKR
ncbi:fungal-specific transcription factor domain-containing protein, partial [Xylogone sp. PMI_703]